MTNPYQILNLSPDTPIEVIRDKYNQLKTQYLEDRFLPGSAGNDAAHKLTQLETAIKIIEAEHLDEASKNDGLCYMQINDLIGAGRYNEAQDALDAINYHSGEWHYMQAMLFYRREWAKEAKTQLEMALNLEPSNIKYQNAMVRLQQVMGNPQTPPQNLGNQQGQPLEPFGAQNAGRLCGPCGSCCAMSVCMTCMCNGMGNCCG